MAELDIHGVMAELAKRRPIFHSEADFQFALAWRIATTRPDCGVRLEKPFQRDGGVIFLDLWLTTPSIPIELKYRTQFLRAPHGSEEFVLKRHAGHPQGRYDFIADIERVESIVSTDRASQRGYAVFLTNDPAYWLPGSIKTKDEAFRLHENQHLAGTIAWRDNPSQGTTRGKEDSLRLRKQYRLLWKNYSALPGKYGKFRYLAVKVE